jgi:hypothetical protein
LEEQARAKPKPTDCAMNKEYGVEMADSPVGSFNVIRLKTTALHLKTLKAFKIDINAPYSWVVQIMAIDGAWHDICVASSASAAYRSGLDARFRMTGQYSEE